MVYWKGISKVPTEGNGCSYSSQLGELDVVDLKSGVIIVHQTQCG